MVRCFPSFSFPVLPDHRDVDADLGFEHQDRGMDAVFGVAGWLSGHRQQQYHRSGHPDAKHRPLWHRPAHHCARHPHTPPTTRLRPARSLTRRRPVVIRPALAPAQTRAIPGLCHLVRVKFSLALPTDVLRSGLCSNNSESHARNGKRSEPTLSRHSLV